MPPAPTQPEDRMHFENHKCRRILSFTRGKMDEPKRLLIVQGHSLQVQHSLGLSANIYQVSTMCQAPGWDLSLWNLQCSGEDRQCTNGNAHDVR